MTKGKKSSDDLLQVRPEILAVLAAHLFAAIEAAKHLNADNPEGTPESEQKILTDLLVHGAKQAKAATPAELMAVCKRALEALPLLEAMQ